MKNVASNYLKLQCEDNKGIFHYEVDFEPRVDNRQECFRLLNSLSSLTGPVKVRFITDVNALILCTFCSEIIDSNSCRVSMAGSSFSL